MTGNHPTTTFWRIKARLSSAELTARFETRIPINKSILKELATYFRQVSGGYPSGAFQRYRSLCYVMVTLFSCTNVACAIQPPAPNDTFAKDFPWSTAVTGPPIREVIPLNNTLSSNSVDDIPRVKIDRKPLLNFNDLTGWKMLLHGDMKATAQRSQEKLLQDDYSLRIDFLSGGYSKGKYNGYFELVPPNPIMLKEPFNTMTLWKQWHFERPGNYFPYSSHTTNGKVYLYIRDSKNDIYKLSVGDLRGTSNIYMPTYWGMLQGTVYDRPWKSAPNRNQVPRGFWYSLTGGPNYETFGNSSHIQFPVALESIAVYPPHKYGKKEGVQTIYLDSLSCFESPRTAYKPKDTAPLLHTKGGIVPTVPGKYETTIQRDAHSVTFTTQGEDGTLLYRYVPKKGDLSDLTLRRNDGKWVTPFVDGGLTFCPGNDDGQMAPPPYGERVAATLQDMTIKDDTLTAAWHFNVNGEDIYVRYHFQLQNQSLVLTIDEPAGRVYGFTFGHPVYDGTMRRVDVPYLTFSNNTNTKRDQPYAVLLDNDTFLFSMLDWTVSDASFAYGAYPDEKTLRMNGGCVYQRLSDGRRNPFHERIVLSASPDYLRVLPNIPNPSGQRERVSKNFFMVNGGLPSGATQVLHNFGVKNILYFTFAHSWLEHHVTSGFFRDEMTPGTAKKLPQWLQFMHSLGYQHGGYADFLAIDPTNKYYRYNAMALGQSQNFQLDLRNSFRPKIPYALDVFDKVEPEMRKRYGLAGYYFDTYSAFLDNHIIDYDANAYGAGKFRTGVEAIAKMLHLPQKSGAISFSEGKRTYMYAGYVDVDYGTLDGWGKSLDRPMLPAFCLREIHDKTALIGGFGLGNGKPANPNAYDQRRAFLVAYGMGDLQVTMPGSGYAGSPDSFSGFLKNYFMFYAYQQACMPANVKTIQYFDNDGKPHDTSEAIKQNLVELGRLGVTYDNGLEVYVNYNANTDWKVTCMGQDYILPPYGFVFAKGDSLLGFAVRRDGHKLEYIRCPDYVYLDTHDQLATVDNITADGAVLIQRSDNDTINVIPAGGYADQLRNNSTQIKSDSPQNGCRLVRFAPDMVGANFTAANTRVVGINDQGQSIDFPVTIDHATIEIHPTNTFQRYHITSQLK